MTMASSVAMHGSYSGAPPFPSRPSRSEATCPENQYILVQEGTMYARRRKAILLDMAKLHRTTVDVDVDAFERARALLGTRGYRDTIDRALREVDRQAALRRAGD